jgi:hypothetical protein
MSRSLFTFTFRLSPWEACLNLNFHEQYLAPDCGVVCTRDQLLLLWAGDPEQNDAARDRAGILARQLIHASAFHTFPAGSVMDVEPVSWLEVPRVASSTVVAGYMSPTLKRTPLESDHPDGRLFKESAELVRKLNEKGNVGVQAFLGLSDFHSARKETGPYSAFYAFRVLEDVAYAFGANAADKPEWATMNRAFGTTEDEWKPLTAAGTWARHLSEAKLEGPSPPNKDDALQLSHRALKLLLKHLGVHEPPPAV